LGHKFEVPRLTRSEGLCRGVVAAVLARGARQPGQRTEQRWLLLADGAESQRGWQSPGTWTNALWWRGFSATACHCVGLLSPELSPDPLRVSAASPGPRRARPLARGGGMLAMPGTSQPRGSARGKTDAAGAHSPATLHRH